MCLDGLDCFGDLLSRDIDFFDAHPAWMGDPLGSEALEVFDGVVGGVEEEFAD